MTKKTGFPISWLLCVAYFQYHVNTGYFNHQFLDSEGLWKKTYLYYFIMAPQKWLFAFYCSEISWYSTAMQKDSCPSIQTANLLCVKPHFLLTRQQNCHPGHFLLYLPCCKAPDMFKKHHLLPYREKTTTPLISIWRLIKLQILFLILSQSKDRWFHGAIYGCKPCHLNISTWLVSVNQTQRVFWGAK